MSSLVQQSTMASVQPLGGLASGIVASPKFTSNVRILAGQLVACQPRTAVNAVQTFTITGTPTTGVSTWLFDGIQFNIAYNSTAAQLQATLDALTSIGPGNVVVTGGAFPGTPLVVTFSGSQMAGKPQNAFIAVSNTFDTGSIAVAQTTVGVGGGLHDVLSNVQIANPSAAPSVSSAGSGTWPADTLKVQIAWGNDLGWTRLSPPANVTVAGSTAIRVAAINAANTPDGAKYLGVWVDGIHAATISVTTPGASGNVAQTDIADGTGSLGIAPPDANRTAGAVGIAVFDITTDNKGRLTYSQGVAPQFGLGSLQGGDVWLGGRFRLGDLTGYSSDILRAMGARFVTGSPTDTNSIILFP